MHQSSGAQMLAQDLQMLRKNWGGVHLSLLFWTLYLPWFKRKQRAQGDSHQMFPTSTFKEGTTTLHLLYYLLWFSLISLLAVSQNVKMLESVLTIEPRNALHKPTATTLLQA